MGSSMVIVCIYGDGLMTWRKGVSRPLAGGAERFVVAAATAR